VIVLVEFQEAYPARKKQPILLIPTGFLLDKCRMKTDRETASPGSFVIWLLKRIWVGKQVKVGKTHHNGSKHRTPRPSNSAIPTAW